MFRNEANYLEEWIEYHKMIGVGHFLLYNDRSEDHWAEVLKPYIEDGLVEVIEWHKPEDRSLFPGWQTMAYKDGLRRLKGFVEWVAFIDIDEFILPKKNRNIVECLREHFSDASGVFACWRNFGTGKVYIEPGQPILNRLTKSSQKLHSQNASGKSIVKLDAVAVDQIWSPHQLVLVQGSQYYDGSGHPLYFQETDLQIRPQHTSDYIQINHYAMRDENYYRKVRLPKAVSREYGQLHLLLEHYQSFNAVYDDEMIQFLQKYYPEEFKSFWMN